MYLSALQAGPSVHKQLSMETIVPTTKNVLMALLRADLITQWRNRRANMMVLLVPVIMLISWKGAIPYVGGAFVLSSCITVGLTGIGLMGYSNAVARDRDKGIFQRLRVAPMPAWCIMASKIIVQLFMIVLVTAIVFIGGRYIDGVTIVPAGYLLTLLSAIFGGAVYLGLGQMIAGRFKSAEAVNSATRLVFLVFIVVGMLGDSGVMGPRAKNIVEWSPYGTVKTILSASMDPSKWASHTTTALLVTCIYGVAFSLLGIKWFKWSPV